MNPIDVSSGFECPIPSENGERILLGHGSGGKLTSRLIQSIFRKYLNSAELAQGNDAAVTAFPPGFSRIAVTTDSHVVKPLFYHGGDIGRLAVSGTVNDLLTSGAVPYALSASFILEEGLEINILERVLQSMQAAAVEAGVIINTADTKVVERGKCDGMYITTSGIGWVNDAFAPAGDRAEVGDSVLISGKIAAHGIAVMCARGELGFQANVRSDNAPLTELAANLRDQVPSVRVLRDPTRGGLATTLNEIAAQSQVTIALEESAIPVDDEAGQLCELLGFDPLWVANEGKMIVIVPAADAEKTLQVMRASRYGEDAAVIGKVVERNPMAGVTLRNAYGTHRIIDALPGEMLPRIC